MENKICVYAIAKNEEANVESWVASMRPADHIIVLDTGSTDNTVEKLRSLGVEVHEKKYDHFRFDVARNDSLELVPDEYNIRVCTDLDERWGSEKWADKLKEIWKEDAPRVVYKYVWSHTNDNNQDGLVFTISKIHGKENFAWEGAVHEYLYDTVTGKKEYTDFIDMTDEPELILHHFINIDVDKSFYLDLAKERAEELPDDFQTWYLLANEQRTKGSVDDAIETYLYMINHDFDNKNLYELTGVYYHLGQCYLKQGRNTEAMNTFSNGIAINKYYRDNYYGLAIVLIQAGLFEMAIGVAKEALKTTKRVYGWMEDPFTWSYALYDVLGVAYAELGEYDKAIGYMAKAVSFMPEEPTLQKKLNEFIKRL